jgi:hypothetical protein
MSVQPKKNKKLDLVKSKSSLQKLEAINTALDELREKIKEKGDVSEMHDDDAFIANLCECVENITKVSLTGSEKSNLVIKLLLEVFSHLNNEKDLKRIQKSINFIVSGNFVKVVPDSKLVAKSVWNFFLK